MSRYIKSRKHAVAPLAALAASLTLPLAAHAADEVADPKVETAVPAAGAGGDGTLPVVRVNGLAGSDYKVEKSASSKLTQSLLETPKTISVIRKEVLREQGAVSLMEALQNTPGITMQLGENGNSSAGDTFQMRGFSANTSTFVDGIRDLGAVTRDVFNLEQIEVVKGPAGADIGRGASAGYINLISKLAQAEDFVEGTFTVGDASRKRASVDVNQRVAGNTAVRLNAVWQDNGVPGRDVVDRKTYGVAPSIAFGLGSPTRFFLYSQHVRQDNTPDGGIPTIGWKGFYNANLTGPAAKVNSDNFYGSVHDYEKIKADMVTAKLEMDLGGGTTVRNVSRYGRNHMDRQLTGIINLVVVDTPANAVNPAVVAADPSTWQVTRSRQRVDQTNEILANQTSINTSFATGGVKHDLATGIELMYESQDTLAFAAPAAATNPNALLYRPNHNLTLGQNTRNPAGDTSGSTTTQAIYALDTLSLTDALKLTLGLRSEHYKVKYSTATGTLTTGKWITSWNTGLLYKLSDSATVYAAAANSLTPPGSANSTLSATGQNGTAADPQEATNYELGTKWDLLNKRLNLSAALYRSENDGQVTTDTVTNLSVQNGKTRVQGIELAAVGQLTNFWQVTAGVQTMDSKQLSMRSVNANTGAVTITDAVRWTPKWSATLWTSYQFGDFTVGGGARHIAEQKRVVTVAVPNATPANTPNLPAYTVVDLMGAWRVNKNVNLQLNVTNLFDKDYMSSLNNGGGRLILGAPRAVSLMANIGF